MKAIVPLFFFILMKSVPCLFSEAALLSSAADRAAEEAATPPPAARLEDPPPAGDKNAGEKNAVTPETAGDSAQIFIEGSGQLTGETVSRFMISKNSELTAPLIRYLFRLYQTECATEGINSDLALAQMMLETDFLRYGGDVHPNQFNFAGIGAVGNRVKGASFPDMQTGIRAHIQHLKAYASAEALSLPTVDPRYHLVAKGKAVSLRDLTGRWATAPHYDRAIYRLLCEMRALQAAAPEGDF